jgi:hypothetical protein
VMVAIFLEKAALSASYKVFTRSLAVNYATSMLLSSGCLLLDLRSLFLI